MLPSTMRSTPRLRAHPSEEILEPSVRLAVLTLTAEPVPVAGPFAVRRGVLDSSLRLDRRSAYRFKFRGGCLGVSTTDLGRLAGRCGWGQGRALWIAYALPLP